MCRRLYVPLACALCGGGGGQLTVGSHLGVSRAAVVSRAPALLDDYVERARIPSKVESADGDGKHRVGDCVVKSESYLTIMGFIVAHEIVDWCDLPVVDALHHR